MKEDVLKIMGYEEENILNRDGNKATVLDREKLFGIFQIKITSEIEFDDKGNVLNKKQSLWNRILSFLSF
ncbi:MAG: hypothetical protein IPN70_03145 [Candidatus Moraniibacteriota bacterium]|nr:MAG: hypothetical protein IPN70_03145 [Candidatus Moranbacteria bacterium]